MWDCMLGLEEMASASQALPSLPSLGCQVYRVTVSGVTLQVAGIWEDSFLLVPLASHTLVWAVASLQVGVAHVFQGLGGPWAPASYLGTWATLGTVFSFTHAHAEGSLSPREAWPQRPC